MIKEIDITIRNGCNSKYQFTIDVENKEVWNRFGKKKIEENQIIHLLDILSDWKHDYGTSKLIDAEEFYIKVIYEDKIEDYCGEGNYPLNYDIFKEEIGELDGR